MDTSDLHLLVLLLSISPHNFRQSTSAKQPSKATQFTNDNMLSSTPVTLPKNFVPREQHVVVGRGRQVHMLPGNVKFSALVQRLAPEYKDASGKAEKGNILSRIINDIYDAAPDAGFVRKDPRSGEWELVCEALARQTVAQAMRNALHTSYRSSKQFKSKRRMIRIQQEQVEAQQLQTASAGPVSLHIPQYVAFPRCVSPAESCNESSSSSRSSRGSCASTDMDTVDLLLAAFAPTCTDGNPFEPTPITPLQDMSLFEPIPLTL